MIVGQNNAGKTASLEAFDVSTFGSNPHKRLENQKPATIAPHSVLEIEIVARGAEFKHLVLSKGGSFNIPVETPTNADKQVEGYFDQSEISVTPLLAQRPNART